MDPQQNNSALGRPRNGLSSDAEDLERSAEALRPQLEQFFEATTDAIIFLDRNYNFTFLNRRAKELIAFDRDLRGKNLFETFPGTAYENSPFVENYRKSMEEGIVCEFEAFYPEPMNFWLRIHSYPAADGIMIFFRDFTQEKQNREALERQHSELETIYRTAPIGLALFDAAEYRYLRLNDRQAAFFGLKPEQIVGRRVTDMAPIEGLQDLFDKVALGEPVVNYPLEGALVTDPSEYRYWTVSYFPVFAPGGSIQAITAASLEITEQKKAERALIESEKLAAVGRLASSIAHEINNPLESVTNLLYLARSAETLEQACEYINVAEIELRRAAAITTQTLRFHKQSTNPQEVSLAELLNEVVSVYQGRIVNARIQVIRDYKTLRRIRCFGGEIRQVLSNLIGNALDAMGEGSKLTLRAREGTNWQSAEKGLLITIADTGVGMSAAVQQKLFKPFFTTKGQTGTGLGLWISEQIVSRHNGALRVRSSQTQHHHGTVFTLFLPFAAVVR
jgi:PAS domain S-box-containing protein